MQLKTILENLNIEGLNNAVFRWVNLINGENDY